MRIVYFAQAVREFHGESLETTGARIGINFTALYRFENGERNPSVDCFGRLLAYCIRDLRGGFMWYAAAREWDNPANHTPFTESEVAEILSTGSRSVSINLMCKLIDWLKEPEPLPRKLRLTGGHPRNMNRAVRTLTKHRRSALWQLQQGRSLILPEPPSGKK
jgi:hypothetical protein